MRLRTALVIAVSAATMLASLPLLAADPLPWPWKSKTPVDPALALLTAVSEVTATTGTPEQPILTIAVKAKAPSPGYSEFDLTPKIGDPDDRIFAFEARGRAPQEIKDEETDANFEVSYKDAPIGKFDVIEVYSKTNCVAYSVKESKPISCTGKPTPPAQ